MSVIPTAKCGINLREARSCKNTKILSLTCVTGLFANFLLTKIDNTTFLGLGAHHEAGIDEMI
jgi:hypothetical protein